MTFNRSDILTPAWHSHCCPVCCQTWSHTRPRCAEPEESLCNSCLVYPVLPLTDHHTTELQARIDSLERVAEAALVLRELFHDPPHPKLLTLTTFVNEAMDAALRDLEAALSAAGYEDDRVFSRQTEKPRQIRKRPEEGGEQTRCF